MKMRNLSLAVGLCALVLAAGAVPPANAEVGEAALGAEGEVYIARAGTYGELFPGATAGTSPSTPVLALDILHPDGASQRLLVPSSNGPEIERSPAVLYEEDSETVYLVWESQEQIHPLIRLASYDGRSWSPAVRITGGNSLAAKTSPSIAVTRDAYQETVEGEQVTRHRTIVHLLWSEERASVYETFYSPVILEDGVYLGWNPIFNLNELSGSPAPLASPAPAAELVRAPVLQRGSDGRTVVAAFASATTRRVTTLEVDVLPRELVRLADATRSTIIDVGRRPTSAPITPNLRALAEGARNSIFATGGASFHDEILRALADQAQGQILAGEGQEIVSIGEATRSTIIDVGAKFSRRGLRGGLRPGPNALTAGNADSAVGFDVIEQIFPEGPHADGGLGEAHVLHFQVMTSRPAPRTGSNGVRVFVSESGDNALVSWKEPGKLVYRDTTENGWAEPRELRLSNHLTLERAYEILQLRVQNR